MATENCLHSVNMQIISLFTMTSFIYDIERSFDSNWNADKLVGCIANVTIFKHVNKKK